MVAKRVKFNLALCATSVSSVHSVVVLFVLNFYHHVDTEYAEIAQRKD
jgi:hypothetical protein